VHDAGHRDVRDDNDREHDGQVESLVVPEVPVVVTSERDHAPLLPRGSAFRLPQEQLSDLHRVW